MAGPVKETSVIEAQIILSKPVVIHTKKNGTVVFTKEKLLGEGTHLKDDHLYSDYKRRCQRILYAINAVRDSEGHTYTHTRKDGGKIRRTKWRKHFTTKENRPECTILVYADPKGFVREVFTFYPEN